MKRYLHFYVWLTVVIMMVCSATTMFAQTKVTSLSQLKVGSVIKIYPKESDGTSHYGDSKYALACSDDGDNLTSYWKAKYGDRWTLVDAGNGYYCLKNNFGYYWTYQGTGNGARLTCVSDANSAVKVRLCWNPKFGGICFWNKNDDSGLTNLYDSNYQYNWYLNSSDANATFDIEIIQNGSGNVVQTNMIIDGDFKYNLDFKQKTAQLLPNGYDKNHFSITIPSNVVYKGTDYKITSLGDDCFFGCKGLTEISLPEGINSLGKACFAWCGIEYIDLPQSLTSLGKSCFIQCSNLSRITLPEGITSIPDFCFEYCSNLRRVTLPSTMQTIEDRVFDHGYAYGMEITCFATVPPKMFSNAITSDFTLYVHKESLQKYKNESPWNNASEIYPLTPSIEMPGEFSMVRTTTAKIDYSICPINVANKNVKWSSDAPTIATVDEKSGVVTAHNVGDAAITVALTDYPEVSASTTVHVTPLLVNDIKLNKETMNLPWSSTESLTAIVAPDLADNKTLKWTSDDESIAMVMQDGVVKGVNVGTTNVTATAIDGSNVSAICKVIVTPASIELSTKTVNLQQGGTYSEQEIKVLPDISVNKNITWASTDPNVASIDANGMITANKPGIATIRYVFKDDKSVYADSKVIVYAPSVVYVGGLYYLLDGKSNTATVTGIYGANGNGLDASRVAQYYSGTINIPRSVTYNGITYDVTNVGSYSFACQNDLQSIFIPTSVKTVEQFASTKAEKLQMVNVEEESQLVNIGENAFKECTGLRFFTFEGTTMKMKSIDASAFYGCSKLKRVKWVGKSTLMTIGDYAFYKCISLNNFAMPNSVLSVGNYSFRYCAGLTNVSLSSTLSIIYEYAFGECGFSHITLPESLVSVQAGSFINNQYLEDITFPARMEGIGSAAFENNASLGTVTFKTEINTMTIGDNAFNLCPALSKVNIEHLDSWAHTNFKNAKANPANTSHNIYMNGVEIIDVVLPTGTRYVNNNAFNGCSHIKSLSMPATIDRINDNIIYGCSNLKDVYCYATEVPPFIGTQDPAEMDDVFKAATLHVIYGNENAYKADSWWGRFAQVAGCNAPAPDPIKVESITISQTEATLKPDDTIQLSATVYPTNADNKKINWKSSNENVAMVTDEGFVLALAEGTSDIIVEATDGSGIKAVCKITVEKKPSPDVKLSLIEFVNSAVTIEQGKSVLLGVNYYPENATNKQLAWTSARTGVATVDDKGVVTAVGEGKTVITAKSTDGTGLFINCVVTVTPATGIGNITMGDVKLIINKRHLKVEGLADNDVVQIINTIGFTVYKGTEHEIDLKAAGIYIIKVKGKTLKFSVK